MRYRGDGFIRSGCHAGERPDCRQGTVPGKPVQRKGKLRRFQTSGSPHIPDTPGGRIRKRAILFLVIAPPALERVKEPETLRGLPG